MITVSAESEVIAYLFVSFRIALSAASVTNQHHCASAKDPGLHHSRHCI
jgi:hypothetical protein